jgi:cell division protein ZapA
VACRDGEEETLKAAARLVDAKSREALAGLGTLSEARQLLFAGLLLADQLIDQKPEAAAPAAPDPELASRAERIAERLESLADALESEGQRA